MYIDEYDTSDLPKITDQQFEFVRAFYRLRRNRVDAYRAAYDTNGSYSTCWKEATRLLNNPKVAKYIEFYEKQYAKWADREIKYSIQDAMDELEFIHETALETVNKDGQPNLQSALKAVELKCKIKGYGKENIDITGNSTVTLMDNITMNGKEFEYKIGEEVENDNNASDNIG